MKKILFIGFIFVSAFSINAQELFSSVNIFGSNPIPSVNGFLNKLELTNGSHGALVFHPGKKDELMFGFHGNGNFYWGTGRSATRKDYYSMILNGSNGNLRVQGTTTTKSTSIFGNNPTASVNGFSNKLEFTGGSHGALVFHPGQKDELMFGLHGNGNFYWGTGRSATKKDYYSMYLNGSNGNLNVQGTTTTKSTSITGANPTPSVNGFQNRLEFKGGAHGALVFHPGQKDELMFGLHSNGNFYWGTGRSATKKDYYSMFLNGSNGNLGVRGKLTANEVEVKIGGWADFVFKKDYKLPSLEEVENHILEKGHLSNIPSEEQVLENGINLGEMDAKLLQKIEELTLYTIQQEKEIKRLKSIEKRLEDLEKLIKSKN